MHKSPVWRWRGVCNVGCGLFVLCVLCAGAAKLLGTLQEFKVKYAEARAKEHPELQAVYTEKVAAMKKAGEAALGGGRGKGREGVPAASCLSCLCRLGLLHEELLPPVGVWLCQVVCTLLRCVGWCRDSRSSLSHTNAQQLSFFALSQCD